MHHLHTSYYTRRLRSGKYRTAVSLSVCLCAADVIEMAFGLVVGLGPRNEEPVLDGAYRSPMGRAILG